MSKFASHDYRVSTEGLVVKPAPTGPGTQDVFTGTTGNDHIAGTALGDDFDMSQGGRDVVKGGKGNDQFNFGATLAADDRIDGGLDSADPFHGNRDAVSLDGDYSAGLVFSATTMTNVETLLLHAGNSYDLTFDDAQVNAADIFRVKLLGRWGAGDNLTFDGSAETDGSFEIFGGKGRDVVTGGANVDTFTFARASLAAADRVDGGAGFDTVLMNGDYSAGLTTDADTLHNIEVIYFGAGFDYDLTINDGNVAAGETLTVSGAFLEVGDSMAFDGTAERDGFLNAYGGDANDLLIGGRRGDLIQGNEGGDTLEGGKGRDTYGYAGGANESQSGNYDTVVGFDFDNTDVFDMVFEVTGVDTAASGALNHATFDADLKAGLAGNLLAGHAILYAVEEGDLTGELFLVIDADGKAGYKAGIDVVVHLADASGTAAIDASDFV